MMKALIISLTNSYPAQMATRHLMGSIKRTKSKLEPLSIDATTPMTFQEDLEKIDEIDARNLQWTWPIEPSQDGMDLNTGLYKRHYTTDDMLKVVACMVSHMRCWQMCIDLDETVVILEHDAEFTRKFDFDDLKEDFKGGIIGLNHPKNATRRAKVFHDKVSQKEGLQPVPSVQESHEDPLPQGLAGNSAYVISPAAAKKLLNKTKEVGLWPNDAIMCKQLFPWMQVVFPYYTKVQGLKSTTTK
jgi:GR25 family glycosyltransferase involved in LPS biosynthesis